MCDMLIRLLIVAIDMITMISASLDFIERSFGCVVIKSEAGQEG